MSMKRCENGHFYDVSKHVMCPYCGVNIDTPIAPGATQPHSPQPHSPQPHSPQLRPTEPRPTQPRATQPRPTQPRQPFAPAGFPTKNNNEVSNRQTLRQGERNGLGASEGVTKRIIREQTGIDPVCGWLVCIAGPERGRSYLIRSERNFIGRSDSMDIAIKDQTISKIKHAIISFNPELATFSLAVGESRSLVYIGRETVDTSVTLQGGDIIRLGNTQLMFIPFCGQYYNWVELVDAGEESEV